MTDSDKNNNYSGTVTITQDIDTYITRPIKDDELLNISDPKSDGSGKQTQEDSK